MKISIHEDETLAETEIVIRCKQADEPILNMLAHLRAFDKKLTGYRDGRIFLIDAADVLYFESVDKRTFLYTKGDTLETPLRLYELEELAGFFRASKSVIVNISQIASLRPELSGKIEATLGNGEKLFISRQYAPEFKQKLKW